ncbi:MAG: ATP-binding cassette domain-containing protein [Mycoplasma sp.]|nr:ATP-binding cassette domain-containing protein [Mycoplasma sp.]
MNKKWNKIKLDKSIPSIEVKDYTKKFKKFLAASNMNFKVGSGVIHGFIGPNGSGKTTAIKAMIGAYIPTSGSVVINGHKAGSKEANSLIGYIPERASFPAHLNTINYLITMGELSGLSFKESKERATKTLKDLGLEEHAKRKPIGFSSGMQKKILLAQSLLTNPYILILDEPAANLDPTARKDLFDQLIRLRNEGKTILISSHILAELERLINEVTFVYYGEVVYSGPTKDLYDELSDVFVKTTNNLSIVENYKDRYQIEGDVKTEIIFKSLSQEQTRKLFNELSVDKSFNIRTFRANDLQSAYDKLIFNSQSNSLGKQKIGNRKVIAMKQTLFGNNQKIDSKQESNDSLTSSKEIKSAFKIDSEAKKLDPVFDKNKKTNSIKKPFTENTINVKPTTGSKMMKKTTTVKKPVARKTLAKKPTRRTTTVRKKPTGKTSTIIKQIRKNDEKDKK